MTNVSKESKAPADWDHILASPPHWLWDSAAPYFTYLDAHRLNNIFYWGCRLGVQSAAEQMKGENFPWRFTQYETQHYPWSEEKTLGPDKAAILLALAQAAIVREGSNFDMFLACWMWNMMLALRENGNTPTDKQSVVFDQIVKKKRVPTRGQMLAAFEEAPAHLMSASRRERSPRPRFRYKIPEASSWDAITLWHNVRHRIMHMDGLVDRSFLADTDLVRTWERLCADKGIASRLIEGQTFPLEARHVTACFTNYKVAAKALRDLLITFSGQKRGHIDAPGPFLDRKGLPPGTVVDVPCLSLRTKKKAILRTLVRGALAHE